LARSPESEFQGQGFISNGNCVRESARGVLLGGWREGLENLRKTISQQPIGSFPFRDVEVDHDHDAMIMKIFSVLLSFYLLSAVLSVFISDGDGLYVAPLGHMGFNYFPYQ